MRTWIFQGSFIWLGYVDLAKYANQISLGESGFLDCFVLVRALCVSHI